MNKYINYACRLMPDTLFLKLQYYYHFHKKLNLKEPKTYNEKLQWLKLYDRKPEYTMMVDKYLVKEYVSKIIGEEYVIPVLGVWDSPEEIDYDILPTQFVIKCNHDSGGIIICKNKDDFDIIAANDKLKRSFSKNAFWVGREWPYKNVKKKCFAEKYLEDPATNELRDYKFFCFDGKVKALFIASDRQTEGVETKFDFFDTDFHHLPFTNGHPNADILPQKPQQFDEMKMLAEKLSSNIPHVRVDFYEVDGKVYFGEMTFFHWSGCVPFEPNRWDRVFGDWLTLPKKVSR